MRVNDLETFGSAIRKRRKEAGITQAELAKYSGVGRRLVSELERGERRASLDSALTLCRVLGLDLYADERPVKKTA